MILDDDDVDIAQASQVEPEWVIKGLLPVGLTILGAPPKSGKSLWGLIFAAIVARWDVKVLPSQFVKLPPVAGHTQIITSEAMPGSLRNDLERGLRFSVLKEHEGQIKISNDSWRYFISLKEENPHKEILAKIDRFEQDEDGEEVFVGPKLVILDPLIDFHDGDENSAGQMIKVLKPLRDWANKRKCAVIVVHHTGKPKNSREESVKDYRYGTLDLRGTSAIFGKADAVLILNTKTEGSVTPVRVKAIFKRASFWEEEFDLAVWDSDLMEGQIKLKELDKLIVLSAKLRVVEIAQKTGLSESEVVFRLNDLKRRGIL